MPVLTPVLICTPCTGAIWAGAYDELLAEEAVLRPVRYVLVNTFVNRATEKAFTFACPSVGVGETSF